ncbi:lipopolysaccharide biosynthesis protein [Halobaculum sp. EA56]|uniref:lipopolysaccharide biosynthesis protein n=1 Tax=Halobaculum sp. EA56 TaxID=3421648 RepID=UPI003EB70429
MTGPLRRLIEAVTPDEDITSRTVLGGVWMGLSQFSNRALQMVMLVVLARLLTPADFGLYGIALLSLSALQNLSKLGVETALVQRPEDDVDPYLDTVFSIELLRGAVIATVAFLAAPLVGAFFGEPRATPLLRVLAFATLFKRFQNPGTVYFKKDLEFHKQYVYSASGTATRVAVSIGYALVSPTVWALAAGLVVGNLAQSLASYLIHDYRPRPRLDPGRAREVIGYGKWLLGSSVVTFLYGEGDDAFVGWFLSAGALGVYQLAYRFSNAPATEVAHTVTSVVMPSFSKVQDDPAAVREGFRRVMRVSTFVSVPVGVGIGVVAPVFVPVAFGPGWEGLVVPMQVLAAFGVLRSLRSPTSPLFKALGRPDLVMKIHVLRLAALVALIYPLTSAYGVPGTAGAVLLTSAVGLPVAHVLATRMIGERLRTPAVIVAYPVLGSAAMAACAFAVRRVVAVELGALAALVAAVATGVVVYAAVMFALDRRFDTGFEELFGQVKRGLA